MLFYHHMTQILIDSHPGDVCCAACVRCEMAPRKQYVIIISSDMSDGETVSSSVKSLPGARAPSGSVRGQGSGPGPGNYRALRLIRPRTARTIPDSTVTRALSHIVAAIFFSFIP